MHRGHAVLSFAPPLCELQQSRSQVRQFLRLSSRWCSFRSLASKGFPGGYSKRVCACMCPLSFRNSEPTRWCSQMTPDEHPRHHLADGPLSSLYAPSPNLSSFGAAFVRTCCSARPASSSALSVLPEDRIGLNIIYISRFCDHINVRHILD